MRKIFLLLINLLFVNMFVYSQLDLAAITNNDLSIINLNVDDANKKINTDNKEIIEKFYTSFSDGNITGMLACYHKDIVFQDPVFGKLEGERAVKMWEMLLSQKKDDTIITFDNIEATTENGKANWVAKYLYGDKKRKVVNRVSAAFKFKDGKIIEHVDTFNLWKWTRQALGASGFLMGWTPYMKNKIQSTTNQKLDEFINK